MNDPHTRPALRLGEFAVTGQLAGDDLHEVYLAESADHPRVAIERLGSGPSADDAARRRFAEAVGDAQRLSEFGFPRVLASDAQAPRPWVATAYPDGPTLAQHVAAAGPLPAGQTRRIVADVATTLAAVHAVGMVHGRLDPSRIVLTGDGARISDLGIRAPFGGSADAPSAGDPSSAFRAPEQLDGGGWVGSPADVFSLGAIAAFAATGRPPLPG